MTAADDAASEAEHENLQPIACLGSKATYIIWPSTPTLLSTLHGHQSIQLTTSTMSFAT